MGATTSAAYTPIPHHVLASGVSDLHVEKKLAKAKGRQSGQNGENEAE